MRLFKNLSGGRIYDELVHMFSEADPLRVLRRMHEFDLLKFLHPNLRFGAELERLFASIGETLTWYHLLYIDVPVERWFVYFLALLDRVKDGAAHEALERLSVPPRVRRKVMAARQHCREVLFEFYRDPQLPASRIYTLLHPLDIEQVLLMMAKARKETAKRYISLFLTHLRATRVSLTGEDLKRLGIPPGPRYKRLLTALLDARLDGTVETNEDEVAFIRSAARI